MKRVQVVFGRFTPADAQCKRCEGGGRDPVATQSACVYCGGSGQVLEALGAPYTYDAADSTQLFDVVLVDAAGVTQHATVVRLSSTWDGPVKEAYPLPATTMDCPGCGRQGMAIRSACCAACWARVPEEFCSQWAEALAAPGPFKRVGVLLQVRRWLEANPA